MAENEILNRANNIPRTQSILKKVKFSDFHHNLESLQLTLNVMR